MVPHDSAPKITEPISRLLGGDFTPISVVLPSEACQGEREAMKADEKRWNRRGWERI